MARYLIEDTTLTDIADAIREKTGETDLIYPDEMGEKIQNISHAAPLLELRGWNADSLFANNYKNVESFDKLRFDTLPPKSILSAKNMFQYCVALKQAPFFDTSNCSDMSFMFANCSALETVPRYDMRNVGSVTSMFTNCNKLKEVYLCNIYKTIMVGSGTYYGHLLTVECLIHLISELLVRVSSQSLTVGSANLEKLANVYVKTVEVTDEMRAEDALIDEKVPFVVCESTDEGAMLITDYASAHKGWQIK